LRDHKHNKNTAINCFFKTSNNLDTNDYLINPKIGVDSIAIPGEYKCLLNVYQKARYYILILTLKVLNLI
jgi:hypothetical protein